MTLGRLAIHAHVTTLPMFWSTPRKLQGTDGYVKKIIDFHWIQSKYCLSEMLSMYWDLFNIRPMITKLLITCGPITLFTRSAFMETPMLSNKCVIYTTLKFPSSTHTIHIPTYTISFIIHVSTRSCHIHHKRSVMEVWHIVHFWVSYGRCAMHELP